MLPYRTSFNKRERGRDLLAAVGLAGREHSLPAKMSGGEQQDVAIARALVTTPALLLADEPTGNLDSANATEILQLLTSLRTEREMTVILSAHDPQVAHAERLILRFRTVRLVALFAGMLLATTAFTVRTAASRTAQLRTVGTVSVHFVPSYHILVRPTGARTALENPTDTVQPNFLTGIYGGITMAQYHKIAHVPGVQVPAPIAMGGYTLLVQQQGA